MASTVDRAGSLKEGEVWRRPAWIGTDFRFAQDFDIVSSLPVRPKDRPLLEKEVECEVTPEDLSHKIGGMTRKFFCQMKKPGGGTQSIKVKYKFQDGEIPAEVMGTRLLWALGFPADQMFMVEKLKCRGCTADPFTDRRIDPETLKTPREFENVAVETRFTGKEIPGPQRDGWSFSELLASAPSQIAQREALRLLVVFLRYTDNKPDNQRLVCEGEKTSAGGCSGSTVLMLHDLGVSFGSGASSPGQMNRADYPAWVASPVWKTNELCIGELGPNHEREMEEPVIRESGRAFLAHLLLGFSEGAEGRARVESLFRYAHADWRMGTIEQWTETFLDKVESIAYPMGRARPDFRCPQDF